MSALSQASVPELLEQAIDSAKLLASQEARLALAEADTEMAAMRRALALWFCGAFLGGAALSWAGFAVMLAMDLGAVGVAASSGAGVLACGLVLWAALRAMPNPLFSRTRSRIEQRIEHVKESLS